MSAGRKGRKGVEKERGGEEGRKWGVVKEGWKDGRELREGRKRRKEKRSVCYFI